MKTVNEHDLKKTMAPYSKILLFSDQNICS